MGIEHDALRKKEKINSKLKGNKAELKVAKLLTEWTGQQFNRTPASGGLRWIETQRIAGDVVAPVNFDFPFVVEVKSYKNIEFREVLRSNSMILNFFNQVERDALRANKLPLLFVRINGMPVNEFKVFFRESDFKKDWLYTTMFDDVEHQGIYESMQSKCMIMGMSSEKFLNIGYESLIKGLKDLKR